MRPGLAARSGWSWYIYPRPLARRGARSIAIGQCLPLFPRVCSPRARRPATPDPPAPPWPHTHTHTHTHTHVRARRQDLMSFLERDRVELLILIVTFLMVELGPCPCPWSRLVVRVVELGPCALAPGRAWVGGWVVELGLCAHAARVLVVPGGARPCLRTCAAAPASCAGEGGDGDRGHCHLRGPSTLRPPPPPPTPQRGAFAGGRHAPHAPHA